MLILHIKIHFINNNYIDLLKKNSYLTLTSLTKPGLLPLVALLPRIPPMTDAPLAAQHPPRGFPWWAFYHHLVAAAPGSIWCWGEQAASLVQPRGRQSSRSSARATAPPMSGRCQFLLLARSNAACFLIFFQTPHS